MAMHGSLMVLLLDWWWWSSSSSCDTVCDIMEDGEGGGCLARRVKNDKKKTIERQTRRNCVPHGGRPTNDVSFGGGGFGEWMNPINQSVPSPRDSIRNNFETSVARANHTNLPLPFSTYDLGYLSYALSVWIRHDPTQHHSHRSPTHTWYRRHQLLLLSSSCNAVQLLSLFVPTYFLSSF